MPASAERATRPPAASPLRDARQMLGIFGTILVLTLLVGAFSEPGGAGSALLGAPAPDFIATDASGAPLRFADLRGRPVWLNFFSSWCVRCRAENPDIQAIYEEQVRTGGDLVVLGVGVGESVATASEYARNAGLTFPIAADPERSASRRYAVLALPTHVFVDREGVIREIRVGALQPEAMRELVAEMERGAWPRARSD